MPTTCGFPNCRFRSRYRGAEDNRHFYRVPKKPAILRKRWLEAIGRTEETIVSQLRVCSGHFYGGEKQDGDIPVADPAVDAIIRIELPPKSPRAPGGTNSTRLGSGSYHGRSNQNGLLNPITGHTSKSRASFVRSGLFHLMNRGGGGGAYSLQPPFRSTKSHGTPMRYPAYTDLMESSRSSLSSSSHAVNRRSIGSPEQCVNENGSSPDQGSPVFPSKLTNNWIGSVFPYVSAAINDTNNNTISNHPASLGRYPLGNRSVVSNSLTSSLDSNGHVSLSPSTESQASILTSAHLTAFATMPDRQTVPHSTSNIHSAKRSNRQETLNRSPIPTVKTELTRASSESVERCQQLLFNMSANTYSSQGHGEQLNNSIASSQLATAAYNHVMATTATNMNQDTHFTPPLPPPPPPSSQSHYHQLFLNLYQMMIDKQILLPPGLVDSLMLTHRSTIGQSVAAAAAIATASQRPSLKSWMPGLLQHTIDNNVNSSNSSSSWLKSPDPHLFGSMMDHINSERCKTVTARRNEAQIQHPLNLSKKHQETWWHTQKAESGESLMDFSSKLQSTETRSHGYGIPVTPMIIPQIPLDTNGINGDVTMATGNNLLTDQSTNGASQLRILFVGIPNTTLETPILRRFGEVDCSPSEFQERNAIQHKDTVSDLVIYSGLASVLLDMDHFSNLASITLIGMNASSIELARSKTTCPVHSIDAPFNLHLLVEFVISLLLATENGLLPINTANQCHESPIRPNSTPTGRVESSSSSLQRTSPTSCLLFPVKWNESKDQDRSFDKTMDSGCWSSSPGSDYIHSFPTKLTPNGSRSIRGLTVGFLTWNQSTLAMVRYLQPFGCHSILCDADFTDGYEDILFHCQRVQSYTEMASRSDWLIWLDGFDDSNPLESKESFAFRNCFKLAHGARRTDTFSVEEQTSILRHAKAGCQLISITGPNANRTQLDIDCVVGALQCGQLRRAIFSRPPPSPGMSTHAQSQQQRQHPNLLVLPDFTTNLRITPDQLRLYVANRLQNRLLQLEQGINSIQTHTSPVAPSRLPAVTQLKRDGGMDWSPSTPIPDLLVGRVQSPPMGKAERQTVAGTLMELVY